MYPILHFYNIAYFKTIFSKSYTMLYSKHDVDANTVVAIIFKLRYEFIYAVLRKLAYVSNG